MNKRKITSLALAGLTMLTAGAILSGCNVTEEKPEDKINISTEEKANISAEQVLFNIVTNMDAKDITINNEWAYIYSYGGESDITSGKNVQKLDMDNKIFYSVDVETDNPYHRYMWVSNDMTYDADDDNEGKAFVCTKRIGNIFDRMGVMDPYIEPIDALVNHNGVYDGTTYTKVSLTENSGEYELVIKGGEELQYTYTYNSQALLKYEEIDKGSSSMSIDKDVFDYSDITVTIPDNIKSMESTATINADIDDVENIIEKYTDEGDFVIKEGSDEVFKYDHDNKVACFKTDDDWQWQWINGDNMYTSNATKDGASKNSAQYFDGKILDEASWQIELLYALGQNSQESAEMSEDGKYYILTASVGSGEDYVEYVVEFNYDEIKSMKVTQNAITHTYTYHKVNVDLDVPLSIRVLEVIAE